MGGTIKRKPSSVLSPKIPLTLNTRSIIGGDFRNSNNSTSGLINPSDTLKLRHRSGSTTSSSTIVSSSPKPVCVSKPPPPIRRVQLPPEEPAFPFNPEDLPPPPPELLNDSSEEEMPPPMEELKVSFAPERLKIGSNPVGQISQLVHDPPPTFLTDLQRVMQKKWQVAQKCSDEPATNPHEILGFRPLDTNPAPIIEGNNGMNNVRAWVSQHYGADVPCTPQQSKPTIPQPQGGEESNGVVIYENFQGRVNKAPHQHSIALRGKKPAPPIPRRADSTHLSAHIVFN